MTMLQPVRIVGGGLAGLSLGIALGRAGVPVELFEAGDYPRHRVCGEFITGLEDSTIEALGIGPALAGARGHRRVSWYRRDRLVARQELPAPARAISRHLLDSRLADMLVAGGGRLHTGYRQVPPPNASGWVNAGGRKPRRGSPWIGLKMHVRDLLLADDLELHLGDAAYVGLSSVEDGWINVCGLFRRRPGLSVDRDRALLGYVRACGLDQLAERLTAAMHRPGSASAVAGLSFANRVGTDDGVQLGDAGGMIPPFTGHGMAMAFIGAATALDPLVAWSHGVGSWESTAQGIRKSLQREFRVRLGGAALLHPFFLTGPLQRGLGFAAQTGILPTAALYRILH